MRTNDLSKIEYYLAQKYSIVLRELSAEDGGGWLAEIPDLPGCMSDGETPQQAIENLEDAKIAWIETALKRGQDIPLRIPRGKAHCFSCGMRARISCSKW